MNGISLAAAGFATAVEKLLNTLLQAEPEARSQLSRLSGLRIQCKLGELSLPLTLQIHEQACTVVARHGQPFDCRITAQGSVLYRLRDPHQLLPLIRAGQLDVEGDLLLLQRLIGVFTLIEWDLEEQLSRVVGDLVAHGLLRRVRRTGRLLQQQAGQQRDWLRELLVEGWRWLPSRAEALPLFQAGVQLQTDLQRLTSRVQRLSLSTPAQPRGADHERE